MGNVLLTGWSFDRAILGGLLLAVALYVPGTVRLRRASTVPARQVPRWRHSAFACALLTLAFAACSPVDYYAQTLFWVHMIQHLLLLVVVAPLLVAAAPWLPMWYGLPGSLRTRLRGAGEDSILGAGRWVCRPVICFTLFLIGTWIWHWPVLYDAALQNDVLHDYGEHMTFLVVAITFWLQVMPSEPFQPSLGYIGRAVYLLGTMMQNVALSVLIGFAAHPLYVPYAALAHRPGGLSALADQQVGAAIMWSFGDLPFLVALAVVGQLWLRDQMEEPAPDILPDRDGPARSAV